MKSFYILLILMVILSMYISYSCAEDLTDEYIRAAEEGPSENLLKIIDYYSKKTLPESTPTTSQPNTVVTSEDIRRGIDNTIYFSSPNSPIKIKKTFSPANKTNYLLGDPIGIYIEISSADEDLTDLSVLEVIDDDLHVLNISNDYGKVSNFDAICEYHKELNRDIFLESENSINKKSKGCRLYFINKTGIKAIKNEEEYNLFNFNLNSKINISEFKDILEVLNNDFKIFWAKNGSANCSIINNTMQINRVDDVDFIKLNVDKTNNSAEININNDRDYEFRARQDGKTVEINDTEVDLRFNLTNLLKREVFVYKYYIKPKKSGTFNTVTVVRSWGRSDTESTASLDVKDPNPVFDITPRPKELYRISDLDKLFNQTSEIVYDITYLGGASEPELHNTKLKLENDINYCTGTFDNGRIFKVLNFTKYKTEHIHSNVKFIENGINPVPGIYVNDKLYNFKDVTVTTNSLSNLLVGIITNITTLMGFVSGIAGFIILVISGKKLDEYIRKKFFKIGKEEGAKRDGQNQ